MRLMLSMVVAIALVIVSGALCLSTYLSECQQTSGSSHFVFSIHDRQDRACTARASAIVVGRFLDAHPNMRVTREIHDSNGAITIIWLEYYTPVA